jgi:hypothetical protein
MEEIKKEKKQKKDSTTTLLTQRELTGKKLKRKGA